MANILPFIRFKPLENIECVGFPAIDGCIVNIETIKPDIDDDFENDHSELGCQLEDGRWIIFRWFHGEDHSKALPAYYSLLWDMPMPLKDEYLVCELRSIASGYMDDIKGDVRKQVEQWLPHLNDQYYARIITKALDGEPSNG